MDPLRAFALGVVQALTEFLPISSSAHLILMRDWIGFGTVDGLTFDVAVHVGTALALMLYFRADLAKLITGFVRSGRTRSLGDAERRMPWLILGATVPAAVVGGLGGEIIERFFRHPPVILVTLPVGGALFLIVERWTHPVGLMETITPRRALVIGLAQCLALIPGVSRSGITIVAGMTLGLERAEAARFSFLLGIPILLGAGLKKALDVTGSSLTPGQLLSLGIGVVTSGICGYLVIRFLLRFLRSHPLNVFAYYRFGLSALLLLWLIGRSFPG